MRLTTLKGANFKSYPHFSLTFHQRVVCFTGDNGSGKTNLLDAIHYLSIGKSYFNPIDQQNIRHEEAFLRLQGVYTQNTGETWEVVCVNETGKRKQITVNEVPDEKLTDHVGRFPVVVIAPDDINLINGGSEERRRFLDFLLSFTNRAYLEALVRYNKLLQQRNATLKQMREKGRIEPTLLDAYDLQLAPLADTIHQWRKNFVQDFMPLFREEYSFIAGKEETPDFQYQSDLMDEAMAEVLQNARFKDCTLQRTTLGPHRDDLVMYLKGHEVKKFGSQGQKKSYLIALKLAAWRWLAQVSGKTPLLLLDDLFDKLDEHRSRHLLDWVAEKMEAQVFITDTSKERIMAIFEHHPVHVELFEVTPGIVQPSIHA